MTAPTPDTWVEAVLTPCIPLTLAAPLPTTEMSVVEGGGMYSCPGMDGEDVVIRWFTHPSPDPQLAQADFHLWDDGLIVAPQGMVAVTVADQCPKNLVDGSGPPEVSNDLRGLYLYAACGRGDLTGDGNGALDYTICSDPLLID